MRVWNGLVQFRFVQARQFPKYLLMHLVQHGPDFGLSGVLGRVSVRHRIRPEEAQELLREQAIVLRLLPSDAPKRQPVLRKSDMTHLPADMTDAARRLSKPLGCRRLIEKTESVIAAKTICSMASCRRDMIAHLHDSNGLPAPGGNVDPGDGVEIR